MSMSRHANHGFSLIEIAVVLVILGFLLGGLLTTLTAQQDAQRTLESQRLGLQAREALLGFVAVNGRLPCPATPGTPSGALVAPGPGVENAPTATGCTGGQTGVLPWATLGLPQLDAWSHRFTYRVSPLFSRTVIVRPNTQYGCAVPPPTAPTRAAFALCTPGDGIVRVSSTGAALVGDAPAVLVSHGPNGFGSRMPTGTAFGGGAVSPDADENENSDGDAIFVDKTRTDGFDDRTEWLATPVLMNRMVQSGRLP